MKQFTDSTGRTWDVAVTIGGVRRIKAACGIDILDPASSSEQWRDRENKPIPVGTRLVTDDELFVKALFSLVSKQAEQRGIGEDDFFDLMDASTLPQAFNAFHDEYIDFFQKSGRTEQARMMEKQLELMVAAHRLATEKVEAVNVERLIKVTEANLAATNLTDQIIAEIDRGKAGEASTNLPASSVLSPAA